MADPGGAEKLMKAGDWFVIIYVAMAIFGIVYAAILALPDLIWPIKDAIERVKRIFK